jgi:hypothetical protein
MNFCCRLLIMNSNLFRLEFLPNELLIDIFQYFHSRDLFRAFYNLNIRFNMLLQSLHYLSLTVSSKNSIEGEFLPYIRVLIIDRAIDTNLNRFNQIQYLILRYPTDQLLAQLNGNTLPHLKHLCVNHMHISVLNRIPDLCDKIFSNHFPNLKSCYLFEWWTIIKIQTWTQSSSLRILKVGKIDLFVYKIILSSCPNLYLLQLATITSNNTPFDISQHVNLKRLIIKTTAFVQLWNDEDVNSCLSYVPCLEHFSVHRTDITVIPKYDWLASIIACHLPYLRRFYFYFHIYDAEIIDEPNLETHENFKILHHNRYQSRFIINRTELF